MIKSSRYYSTSDPRIASFIDTLNVGEYLHIDPDTSSPSRVVFIFTNPKKCRELENEFFSSEIKAILGENLYQNYRKYISLAKSYGRDGGLL